MNYVGTITGTSIDGLDVALLEAGAGPPSIVAAETAPLPAPLAAGLKALTTPGDNEIVRAGAADAELGEFIGNTILACLKRWAVPTAAVRAIGSHGQTIRHHPELAPPFTVQIGDPSRIAELTGIDTVADFRRRDMAAGGEGAPLTPLFHDALFRDAARHRVVINIGGIANATMLPADSTAILGFDTGPGNALLDAWMLHHNGTALDRGGAWAAKGRVIPKLLMTLQADAFVARAPPKSTGKETYHLDYVHKARRGLDAKPEDVQATLAEFTAWSIADALRRWGPGAGEAIICGGGRHNADLMERLAANLSNHHLLTTDDLGVDGDALEAAAFAWLAHRALARQAGNAPAVTGAHGPRILGAIHPGHP